MSTGSIKAETCSSEASDMERCPLGLDVWSVQASQKQLDLDLTEQERLSFQARSVMKLTLIAMKCNEMQ